MGQAHAASKGDPIMLAFFFQPHVSAAALILRLGVAAIVVFHGALKLAQDGGTGWNPRLTEATQIAVTWGELVCGGCVFFGLVSRLAAIGLIVIQVGAIVLVTGEEFIRSELTKHGFEFGRPGFEYNFALIILCLAIMLLGSGVFSLDHLIWPRRQEPQK